MRRSLKIILAGVVWLLLANGANFAQSVQGSITGVVKDPQSAVVVGASVTVTQVATNVQHSTTTNGSGLYTFPDLLPGTYVVSISAPSFKQLSSGNIILVAAGSRRFDAQLVSEDQELDPIVAKGIAPTLVTDTGETGDLQVGADIVKEPMARNILGLLVLSSATVTGGSFTILIGGHRFQYENLTIDGVTTMNNNFGSQSGGLTADQSFESIAEVKVIDGNGAAEIPGFSSLITTTKGGTNKLHGSAFYTTDNAAFNALQFGSAPPGPKGPELQWYGGSVGGPVWLPKVYNGRSKTFFFVTWEHRTFPLAAGNTFTATANLPTLAFQGKSNSNGDADFSSLLLIRDSKGNPAPIQIKDPFNGNADFAGNIIPHARLSPVALALQNNFYPAPNTGAANQFNANYQILQSSPEHIDREDFRVDHNFSDRDAVSGRITRQVDPQPDGFDQNTLIFKHSRESRFTNLYIAETHSFSWTITNEFRLGYARDNRQFVPSHLGNTVLQQIGLNLASPVAAGTHGFPQITFSGSGIEGMGESGSAVSIAQEYSLLDNITWQKGKHGIKVGALVRYGKPQTSAGNFAQQFGQFNFNGFGTGFDYADFLLGIPDSASQSSNLPNAYIRKTDTGLFAQDSWHATPKLTLTLGLRWEYYMPPVDHNDRRANFDPATGNMVVPSKKTLAFLDPTLPTALSANIEVAPQQFPGRSLLFGRKTNFGPRFGFAYFLDSQMIVRGGYGVYFGQLINTVQANLNNSGLFGTNISAPFNSFVGNMPAFQFPNPFFAITVGGAGSCTTQCGLAVTGTDPHIKTPTSQQWNLTVERDLGRSVVARVSYRGFLTTQLPVTRNLVIPRIPGGAPNFPLFGSIDWRNSGGIQKMNALDLTVERKFTAGLTFRSGYTFAKNLSDVGSGNGNGSGDGEGGPSSNPFDRAADLGNVSFVPRHRFVNNLVWDIPVGKGQKFGSGMAKPADYLLGGWETVIISVLQSGSFLTPIYSGAGSGIIPNEDIDLRPNCNGSLVVSHPSRSEWFNTAAFSIPAAGTYGNCGTGIIQGPGLIGFNFGIHKAFTLKERAKLTFEANLMNAFNHPNLGNPEMNLSIPANSTKTAGFGTISPTLFTGGANLFNPVVTSANGERHIWLGLRLEF